MLNFISPAHASDVASFSAANLMSFMPIIAIFIIFYFLMIRPQQKKMKEHKAMIDAIKIGDHVLTAGGITGTVSKIIDANEIKVLIAPQVDVTVMRSSLSQVYSKGGQQIKDQNPNQISAQPNDFTHTVNNVEGTKGVKVEAIKTKPKSLKAPAQSTTKILKKKIK